MPFDRRPSTVTEPLRWPPPGSLGRGPAGRARAPGYASLLEADEDLADRFEARTRAAAQPLTVARVLELTGGAPDFASSFAAVRGGFGLLVLDGLLARETVVGDRTATQLLGTGDLLQPPGHPADEMLVRLDVFRILAPTRLALLDARFADRVRPWPQIASELCARSGRQLDDVDVLRTIACQPRLELRLVMLLWHLAARWGRVEPSGIRLTLPLTHRLLGQLVGAERPSISHALARLGHSGLVTGSACDLHLHGSLTANLRTLTERSDGRSRDVA